MSSKFSPGILNVREGAEAAAIGVLSAFFLAASSWHLSFSRIGFRAILVPFFASFAMYFLLKGLRRGKTLDMVWSGIFAGLGFHTYIAFRFVPFVFIIPIIGYLWYGRRRDANKKTSCIPCLIALFVFITFIAALPIGWHFLNNPEDFFGRTGQVSVLSAQNPLWEFLKSNLVTAQMFFFIGDCNPRHNFACQAQLHPLVALFFIIGLAALLFPSKFRVPPASPSGAGRASSKFLSLILFAWLFFMSFPATLTREGLPHALRSIGMIPPVAILAGLGAWTVFSWINQWFEKQKNAFPQHVAQLQRIQREGAILGILLLLVIPLTTYRDYFGRWAFNPSTYFAFSTDVAHIADYLNVLPHETRKIVVSEIPLPELTEVGTPAQTVMFLTDSYTEKGRREKNIEYLSRGQMENLISLPENQNTVIALFNGENREFVRNLQKKFPELRVRVPGDFVVLQNF